MYRGFKSHVGYWTGHHDYYDHTAVENPSWGLDIRRGECSVGNMDEWTNEVETTGCVVIKL